MGVAAAGLRAARIDERDSTGSVGPHDVSAADPEGW